MNTVFLILIIILIFIWGLIMKKRQNDNKNKMKNENTELKNEMEEFFLKEVKNGEKTYKLSHIIDEFDFVFIKTLLQKEQIPYYTELDNTLNIWPSRKIGTLGNISIYILEKNYNDVIKLIEKIKKEKIV